MRLSGRTGEVGSAVGKMAPTFTFLRVFSGETEGEGVGRPCVENDLRSAVNNTYGRFERLVGP